MATRRITRSSSGGTKIRHPLTDGNVHVDVESSDDEFCQRFRQAQNETEKCARATGYYDISQSSIGDDSSSNTSVRLSHETQKMTPLRSALRSRNIRSAKDEQTKTLKIEPNMASRLRSSTRNKDSLGNGSPRVSFIAAPSDEENQENITRCLRSSTAVTPGTTADSTIITDGGTTPTRHSATPHRNTAVRSTLGNAVHPDVTPLGTTTPRCHDSIGNTTPCTSTPFKDADASDKDDLTDAPRSATNATNSRIDHGAFKRPRKKRQRLTMPRPKTAVHVPQERKRIFSESFEKPASPITEVQVCLSRSLPSDISKAKPKRGKKAKNTDTSQASAEEESSQEDVLCEGNGADSSALRRGSCSERVSNNTQHHSSNEKPPTPYELELPRLPDPRPPLQRDSVATSNLVSEDAHVMKMEGHEEVVVMPALSKITPQNLRGETAGASDSLLVYKLYGGLDFSHGNLVLLKNGKKPLSQCGCNTLVFYVISGSVVITVNNENFEAYEKRCIRIPPGSVYGIVNSTSSIAELFYTVHKSPVFEEDEELEQ